MKKLIALFSSFILIFVNIAPVYAETVKVGNYQLPDEWSNAVVMNLNSPLALVNGEKIQISDDSAIVPRVVRGVTMIPLRFICNRLGYSIIWNNENSVAEVKGNGVTAEFNLINAKMRIDGRNKAIPKECELFRNTMYIPLDAISIAFGKKVNFDNIGFMTISDADISFDFDFEQKKQIVAMLAYERPSADKVFADYEKSEAKNEHPRLLINADDIESLLEYKETDDKYQEWLVNLRKVADQRLEQPKSTYVIEGTEGLLTTSRRVRTLVLETSMAYLLFDEEKYAKRCWEEIEAAAEFSDWYPAHFLDVGEMSAAFGYAYDLLFDYLSQKQKDVIINTLKQNAFEPFFYAYDVDPKTYFFTTADSNWSVVCNGGVSIGALAIMDEEPELASKVISYALPPIERFIQQYAPDGGFQEGPTYWNYATTYLTELVSALENTVNTDYGLFKAPGLLDTGYFVDYMSSPTGVWNYHDAATGFLSSDVLLWYAKRTQNEGAAALRYRYLEAGRVPTAKDIMWYSPDIAKANVSLNKDAYFRRSETVSMRSSWDDPNAIFTGIHGGSNYAPHAHLDVGTFVLDAQGVRWAEELGSDNYQSTSYWNEQEGGSRWEFYRTRSEGQNTLVINPSSWGGQWRDSTSEFEKFVSKDRGSFAILNMQNAYADYATDIKRGLGFFNDRRTVVVQDEITLPSKSDVWWFMHTKADIEISPDGREAFLTRDGKKMHLRIESKKKLKFVEMKAEPLPTSPNRDDQLSAEAFKKLAIHAEGVTNLDMAVVFNAIGYTQDEADFDYKYIPLNKWSIPDGKYEIKAPDSIKVDGKDLEGFMPEQYDYNIKLPYKTQKVPAVTASSEEYNVVIEPVSELPSTVNVQLRDKTNHELMSVYRLNFSAKAEIEISASEIPQFENPPAASMDNDLNTRWSAEGEQWIMYEFAEDRSISTVAMAFFNGNSRMTFFDIQVSNDGKSWRNVYENGQSGGTTNEKEDYNIGNQNVRFVKINLHGNSINKWNSLTEIEFKN